MSKRTGCMLFSLLAAVFLALNRGAYSGYFTDDDINSLAWTRWASSFEYLKGALTPIYSQSFRAVGFYFYHAAGPVFGLDFPKYVAAIHAIHLLNVWLLWLLLRRLASPLVAAAAGCVFFALHGALLEAVSRPMYIFDLLCGTLCLACVVLWARGNWILSFLAFWLAYKSKELAVVMPAVLMGYELWFGRRRWARLLPFFAVSLWFTVQALALHPDADTPYAYHFTAGALAATAPFYAGQVFLIPYLGLVLPLGALAFRNRRTWFGLAVMGLCLVPLLFLPGRISSAYCYLPFAGLAIAMAGMLETSRPAVVVAFLLLWMPVDIYQMSVQRDEAQRPDRDARQWITTLERFAKTRPAVTGFAFRGMPNGFHLFGVEGAVKYFFPALNGEVPHADSREGAELVRSGRAAVLNWDGYRHSLTIVTAASAARGDSGP